jgi:hypothetical protein
MLKVFWTTMLVSPLLALLAAGCSPAAGAITPDISELTRTPLAGAAYSNVTPIRVCFRHTTLQDV